MMHDTYDSETFERAGYSFRAEYVYDDLGEPWKEHDGHGIVSEWVRRGKRPGERVLNEDHGSFRYYDIQETLKLARKDGWGCRDRKEGETDAQYTARAVDEDFDRMRAWCHDEWHWCYVVVTLLDEDGDETKERESLGGIESDAGSYFEEVKAELADEIIRRLNGAKSLTVSL